MSGGPAVLGLRQPVGFEEGGMRGRVAKNGLDGVRQAALPVLDRCSKYAHLGATVPAGVKLAPEGQITPYWRDMSSLGVACCR